MTLQFTETVDEVALKTALAQVLGIPEALISFQTPTTRRLLAQTASEIVVVIAAPTLDSLQNIQEVESNVEFAGDVTTKMVEVVEQTAQAAFDAGSISAEEKAQTVAQASAVVPPVVADVILDIDEDTYRQRFNINITDFPTKNPTPFPTPSPTAYPTPQPTKAPTPPEGLEYFEKSTQTCADPSLYITTEAKCRDAATTLGLPFAGVAGTEWHSGCLFHHGQVYFSPHEEGSRQDPTHEYICKAPFNARRSGTWCGAAGPYGTWITSRERCEGAAAVYNLPFSPPTPLLQPFEKSTQTCDAQDDRAYIATEATCRDAATNLGLPFAGVAGTEWHSGCLFHHGQVYYSPHEAGSRQDPTHEYICIKQRQWVAGCIVQDNSVWFSPYTSPQYNVEQTNHGYICNADYS
jgi:hypothetical protein